jgi:hypothetical protein
MQVGIRVWKQLHLLCTDCAVPSIVLKRNVKKVGISQVPNNCGGTFAEFDVKLNGFQSFLS